jgi:hypothetical protein
VESICARCGAALSANEQFCKSCGAAVFTGDVAAAFIQPAASEVKTGRSTLKIILIVVAVLFGLGILGLSSLVFIGYRIAKNTHIDPSGRATTSIFGSTMTMTPNETFTAAELGTEIYPGAQSTRGGMKMEMPSNSMVTGVFLTPDSSAQVLAFYKEKLGSAATVKENSGNPVVRLQKGEQEFVMVKISTNKPQDNGKTRITIMHSMKKFDSGSR